MSEPRVIDGDTIEATLLLPFGVTVRPRIRLRDWWAPEREGPTAAQGDAAAHKLETWLKDREVFLFANTPRLDKHGRTVGHLWWAGRITDPRTVLGDYQMTAQAHGDMIANIHKLTSAPRMRPFRDIGDFDLRSMAMGYVNVGKAIPTELVKELEERGFDDLSLAEPAPSRAEGENPLPLTPYDF